MHAFPVSRVLQRLQTARLLNHLLRAYAGWCVTALVLLYSFDLRCAFARASASDENAFDPKGYGFTTHFQLVEGAIVLAFYLWPFCIVVHGVLVYNRRVSFARSVLLLSLQAVFIYAVGFSSLSHWLAD